MYYLNFVLILLAVFLVCGIMASVFLILPKRHKFCKFIGITSLVLCIASFVTVCMMGAIFSDESILNVVEKDYSYLGTEYLTVRRLAPVKNSPYYIIRENGECRYNIADDDKSSDEPLIANAENCLILYGGNPNVTIEEIKEEYYSECMFFMIMVSE